jgi:hypothetical protein
MNPDWKQVNNPDEYVMATLSREADDIPVDKINKYKWIQKEVSLDKIQVDKEMVKDHDQDPLHIKRRDGFVELIRNNTPILPLIVLGENQFLVDGYARYRALLYLGIKIASVLTQDIARR